ncbi:MAG: hypothetical protein HFI63_03950 [Lachnospiraceae bacterium]|nr:hypothetical protein [Lachnospiraceae bacterium]
MLGKLLKYDYRANGFYFLLIYGVLMGIAVVARLSIVMADARYFAFADSHVLSVMAVGGAVVTYLLACGAVVVLTFLLIAMRFYKNLMGPEGYLSFTLPVSKGSHLASKMISGVSYLLLSYLVLLVSAMVVTVGTDFLGDPFILLFRSALDALRMDHLLIFSLYIIEGFMTTVQIVAVIYLSICIGQLATKHRILGAIGMYLAIYLALGMITMLGSVIFMRLLEGYEGTVFYYGITKSVTILFRSLVAAGSLAGSLLLMKYRLNLE